MKKVIFAILMAACLAIPVLAQDSGSRKPIWDHGDNVSELTYRTVPVYKIYDLPDSYVINYEAQGVKIDQVSLPKEWGKLGENHKLYFRYTDTNLGSSMTVFYKNNELYKIVLTTPRTKGDSVWGIAKAGMEAPVTDVATKTFDLK